MKVRLTEMQVLRKYSLFLLRFILALLSGFLLTLSYPPSSINWIVWVALIPIFISIHFTKKLEGFISGLITGIVFYSLSFQWVGAFHRFALLFMALASALCFIAIPVLLIQISIKKKGPLIFLVIPSIWIIFEFIKQNWFLSFPFGILGYTQHNWLRFIQIADISGVFGISWLIILVNLLLSKIIVQLFIEKSKSSNFLVIRYVLLICITFLIPLLYGTYKFNTLEYSQENKLKVGFAQTLFHPKKTWEENKDDYMEIIDHNISMLAGLNAKLIIFPELTIDRFLTLDPKIRLKENEEILNWLSLRAKENGVYILFGGLELANTPTEPDKYNSSFLFDYNGDLTAVYRKNILVPFGEKNPFSGLFPGIQDYIIDTTDAINLMPGKTVSIMEIEGSNDLLKFGVLTCFESGFGQLGRIHAENNVNFIVNMTNDYWSLSSVAMKQHLVFSIFRAIEIRKPVLRISNGGYSGYINEFGNFYSKIPIFQQGMMTAGLRLLDDSKPSFYTKYGEWILILNLIPILLYSIFFLCRKLSFLNLITEVIRIRKR